jgi:hypothetical protein
VQEKASGKAGGEPPRYTALLRRLTDGDRLVVWKVAGLAARRWMRGVHIVITTLAIDLKTPAGRLVFG